MDPSFPNARYVFSALEQKYCAGLAVADERVEAARVEANMGSPARTPVPGVYADSVEPVIEAGLAQLIKIDGGELIEGVSFHPTPGHSIDHPRSCSSQKASGLCSGVMSSIILWKSIGRIWFPCSVNFQNSRVGHGSGCFHT